MDWIPAAYLSKEQGVSCMNDARAWYKAANERHSVRDFDGLPIDDKVLSRLEDYANGFSEICSGARGVPMKGAKDVFHGFGKITGAPVVVAIVADMNSPHPMVSAGYLGQGIVLEAVAARLGTCWVAGFNRAVVDERSGLKSGEEVVAVIAIGNDSRTNPHNPYAAWNARGIGMMVSGSRKPVSDLVSGLPKEQWPSKLDYVFEATRNAPSSRNRQPWRFVVDDEGVTLSVDKEGEPPDPIRHLEGGIAMLNFEVAAKACGISGQWQSVDPPALAKYFYEP